MKAVYGMAQPYIQKATEFINFAEPYVEKAVAAGQVRFNATLCCSGHQ
jgi:hypothetical protein